MAFLPLCPGVSGEARVRAAWQTQVAAAVKTPGLLPHLVQRRQELLPRFAIAYQQLCALPRRVRRHLQRHWKQSLAGVALLLVVSGGEVQAGTTINVPAGDVAALIAALTDANSEVAPFDGADTIVLTNSTFTLTAVNNTTFGATGLPIISSEITIEGNGSTIERDGGAPEFRIMAVNGTGVFTLRQTTLSGAVTSDEGGGIYNSEGTVRLEKSTVSGNSALRGGGLRNRLTENGTSAILILTNSTIAGNSASGQGGGVFNNARGYTASTVTITNSTLSGNSASSGGGVFNDAVGSAASTVTITNSTLTGNSAGDHGGGVYNFANGLGGEAVLTITNSTLTGNSAGNYGGGVYSRGFFGTSTVTITNSTLTGNSAGNYGGGVCNYATHTGNVVSRVMLSRSLVSGNTAAAGAEVYNFYGRYNTVTADNYNLFGHSGLTDAQAFKEFAPSGSDITATSDGTIPTALSAILDPTLADNGGPTFTHALVDGSPAVDASPTDADCEPTDQRGVTRPQPPGGACDIGAFEGHIAVCGNGLLSEGEACDLGAANGTPEACCTTTCTLVAAATLCRPAAGACDVAESCTGTDSACPADAKSTALCRPAADVCDQPESCDGVTDTCPSDTFAAAVTVCRPAAGACDVAESCPGTDSACPADAKSTALCRPATDVCDQPESCDGVTDTCPSDALAPAATLVCRPTADACDVAELCPGASPACPTDLRTPGCDLACAGLVPTTDCTVNRVPHQLCVGTLGNDVIFGTKGDDIILGLDSNDHLLGRGGNDVLCGGAGKDLLSGGAGKDRLLGGSGEDILKGDKGDDSLDGGLGTDALDGGKGIDKCVAGEKTKRCETIFF